MTGNNRGLSLFEILMVIAMISVLAVASVPVAELAYIRTQEQLLEENLKLIRSAIKNWKIDCRTALTKQIQNETNAADIILDMPDSKLPPPSLGALANPEPSYPITWNYSESSTFTATFHPRKYLQQIPIDPFVGAPIWNLHYASGTKVGLFEDGDDKPEKVEGLFDVSPNGDTNKRRGFVLAIDGTKYEDW